MADKALISEMTWRSLKMQKESFLDIPHYVAPHEIETMLRTSTRKDTLNIHVVSLAVIADIEKDFREFIELARNRKAKLIVKENDRFFDFTKSFRMDGMVLLWKLSRRNGAGKAGARISASKKEAATKEALELIRADWPKSSSEFPTTALLGRANISLNTAKKFLGRRPIVQASYAVAQKRKAKRNAI